MGKILDIRVMAQTYDEDEVAKAWPRLVMLAWPAWSAKLGMDGIKDGLPGYSVGAAGPVEKALGQRRHGVMELAAALPDLVKFGDLPENIVTILEETAPAVEKARLALESALGDWDVKKASALTYELEDALSAAEKSLDQVK